MARKFFSSRTKTKKISRHLFTNSKHEFFRAQSVSVQIKLLCLYQLER
ncbi:DUF1661 domain-containing protein [Porphyromonas gulae]|nr:DUF1661 domain-containing protein [Porphyromonas gulae]